MTSRAPSTSGHVSRFLQAPCGRSACLHFKEYQRPPPARPGYAVAGARPQDRVHRASEVLLGPTKTEGDTRRRTPTSSRTPEVCCGYRDWSLAYNIYKYLAKPRSAGSHNLALSQFDADKNSFSYMTCLCIHSGWCSGPGRKLRRAPIPTPDPLPARRAAFAPSRPLPPLSLSPDPRLPAPLRCRQLPPSHGEGATGEGGGGVGVVGAAGIVGAWGLVVSEASGVGLCVGCGGRVWGGPCRSLALAGRVVKPEGATSGFPRVAAVEFRLP